MNHQDYTILITLIAGFLFPPIWLVTLFVVGKIAVEEWGRRY